MSYSAPSKTLPDIVVDANISAGAVLSIRSLETAPALFIRWGKEKRNLYAPDWWRAEVVSVVSQHVFHKLISLERAHEVIDNVRDLEVETVAINYDLLHRALDWANKIGQIKIYDSIYLALAEHLNAELWTADKRLVNSTRALNIDWIKWIGDFE